jgi:hypothetical protein
MGIQTGANVAVSIGTTASATNQTEYEADTYQAIGGVESISEFGDESAQVGFTGLTDGRMQKLKGSRNAGEANIIMAFLQTDSGQQDLVSAEADDSSDNYNFKVEYSDGEVLYFRAQVASYKRSGFSADDVTRVSCIVRINSAILEVAAP